MIEISDLAKEKIIEIQKEQEEEHLGIRISVSPG